MSCKRRFSLRNFARRKRLTLRLLAACPLLLAMTLTSTGLPLPIERAEPSTRETAAVSAAGDRDSSAAAAGAEALPSALPRKCGCPPAVRRAGTCCCISGASSDAGRSCCSSKKPADVPQSADVQKCHNRDKARQTVAVAFEGCPCGTTDAVSLLINAEPRILSQPAAVSAFAGLPSDCPPLLLFAVQHVSSPDAPPPEPRA